MTKHAKVDEKDVKQIRPTKTETETQPATPVKPGPTQDERIRSRFNIGPTDLSQIRGAGGDEREGIAAHLVNNTHVDPKEARRQVDEFYDGQSAK